MSAALRLRSALRAARLRVVAAAALVAVPPLVAAAAVAWRLAGPAAAAVAVVAGLAAAAAFVAWRARRIDRRWLARALDARRVDMEDSAALLFARRADLSPLRRLQRERLRQRIASAPMPDLRPPWPRRGVAIAGTGALLVLVAAMWWPAWNDGEGSPQMSPRASASAVPRLARYRLRIEPPAYTGLEAHDTQGLDAQAPAGSRLSWTLQFDPEPASAELLLHDGVRHDGGQITLGRDPDGWTGSHLLAASALYRIVPEGVPDQPAPPLHRLEAIPDAPPTVRVLAPEGTLSQMAPGQRSWTLVFEATDDYGVAADARLQLTLAKGTGENITFIESTRTLRGAGGAARKRFSVELDPLALGLEPGEDLVARLEVRDNRAPRPQAAHSPSLILRWPPPPPPDIDGLDTLARDVLPAYFRSQRQIIIDAEALLEEQPVLAPERFLARSDGLGVDQRVLRLRYGQFMGEEAEDASQPPPVHDPEPPPTLLPIDDRGQEPAAAEPDRHVAGDGRPAAGTDLHGHDHDQAPRDPARFGSMEGVLEEFAHLHDLPEAATLLNPRTRETLRAALGEMWQSELALRQGDPAGALPYAYRALGYIQQVREADRIYLPRVGTQLPPIDEGRRLGGDRDGIGRRPLPPSVRSAGDDTIEVAWRAMAAMPGPGGMVDLESLQAWLAGNRDRVGDPLSLAAAIDALRTDPACIPCRHRLRAQLWTLIERPAARVQRRTPVDQAGARYLDGLPVEDEP